MNKIEDFKIRNILSRGKYETIYNELVRKINDNHERTKKYLRDNPIISLGVSETHSLFNKTGKVSSLIYNNGPEERKRLYDELDELEEKKYQINLDSQGLRGYEAVIELIKQRLSIFNKELGGDQNYGLVLQNINEITIMFGLKQIIETTPYILHLKDFRIEKLNNIYNVTLELVFDDGYEIKNNFNLIF